MMIEKSPHLFWIFFCEQQTAKAAGTESGGALRLALIVASSRRVDAGEIIWACFT
jgi:hypothetical protein